MVEALDIHVKGIVQGVGFRPFVYRLAKRFLITGWVLNAADGVHIHAEGEEKHLDEFVMELSEHAPAAAQVKEIELKEVPLESFKDFEIRFSDEDVAEERTLVSPDLAICADCERELFDRSDRRFRYPFINCTNCGPRFTIINGLPYDRAKTSMAAFPMCKDCQAEYDDPADRRFHAQPNACFTCGPVVFFAESQKFNGGSAADRSNFLEDSCVMWGRDQEASDRIFAEAAQFLTEGKIIAVKGLGGYHLVCNAHDAQAVAELRKRKHREGKPFAVMMANVDEVKKLCHVSAEEEAQLTGSVRPIVLLRLRQDITLTEGVADGLTELGVMLPYTPVQHLLMHDFGCMQNDICGSQPLMLVMTSGNTHDDPIVIDDEEAFEKLGSIADAILGNNREILTRFDDSVVRVLHIGKQEQQREVVQVIRRARGMAPTPIALSLPEQTEHTQRVVFGTGPEQKNTFTFLRGQEAFVSQHIGDMENATTFDAWLETKARYEELFDLHATEFACDAHPEYLTSKWAHEQAALARPPIPVCQVQHHHAHIVATMAESGLAEAVCGFAFDGTGYGADGNIWGGEVLLADLHDYERFANFVYVPMPGGAAAIKEPLRMAYGVLWEFDLLDHPGAAEALKELGQEQARMCETMIDQGLNTPVTSSVGRLFDAASALLGVCRHPAYEGQAAVLLGAQCDMADDNGSYPVEVVKNTATETSTAHDTSVVLIDVAPAFRSLLDDYAAGVSVPTIARRFHNALVDAIAQVAHAAHVLYDMNTMVLTGGVFMNRYLIEHATDTLQDAGFTVALSRDLPPNDGCVSLGQAVVGNCCES